MKVLEIMSRDVESTRPDASLQQVAEKMKAGDYGSLPVCHEGQLIGMITDRDIVVRSVSEGHDPETDRVADVMTAELIYCSEEDDVEQAAELMKRQQIRRLLVLNRDKQLVGIVSLGDLALATHDLAEEALDHISEPVQPESAKI